MKKSIQPYVLKALSSQALLESKRRLFTIKRKLNRQPPQITVYVKPDDPYSYLLLQALKKFPERFDVDITFRVFARMNTEMFPMPDMLQQYAQYDAYHLAELYGFNFPVTTTSPHLNIEETQTLARILVCIQDEPDFISTALAIMSQFWGGLRLQDAPIYDNRIADKKLEANSSELNQRGHYLGAMVAFEGEWYWGIDRLDHLELRLIEDGLAKRSDEQVCFDRTYNHLCKSPTVALSTPPPLTLYWSARSPYSYIGLEQALRLAQHYQLELEVKPVLPMVMRGLSVPTTKKLYIFHDTKREASKLGLPYGYVADPLGKAVENCYALVEYARDEGKLLEFLLSFARAVNSEGIRGDTDKGLQRIVTRCGLDWNTAKPKLSDTKWQAWAQQNLDEMLELGYWGVPVVRFGHSHFWGQDRMGLIEKAIRDWAPNQSLEDNAANSSGR